MASCITRHDLDLFFNGVHLLSSSLVRSESDIKPEFHDANIYEWLGVMSESKHKRSWMLDSVQMQELQNQVDFLRSTHPSGLVTLDPAHQGSIDTKLPFADVDCKSPEQMVIDESQSVFKVFDY